MTLFIIIQPLEVAVTPAYFYRVSVSVEEVGDRYFEADFQDDSNGPIGITSNSIGKFFQYIKIIGLKLGGTNLIVHCNITVYYPYFDF